MFRDVSRCVEMFGSQGCLEMFRDVLRCLEGRNAYE